MSKFSWKEASAEEVMRLKSFIPGNVFQNFSLVRKETLTQIEFGLRCKLCQGEYQLKYGPQSFEKAAKHLEQFHVSANS
jgi:hypothetical protein